MKIESALNELEEIVIDMKNQNIRERLVSYSVITAIINGLDKIAETSDIPISMYKEYKQEFMWSCETICGLDDGNDLGEERHVMFALGAISKMKTGCCFGR